MSSYRVRETFFRPEQPFSSEHGTLPADIVNGLRRLFAAAGGGCVFLPVRSMQYQAVIDRDEVVFVDANGGYAHQDGEGGRLIRIAWCWPPGSRDTLSGPVPCEIVRFFPGLEETQRRLVGEVRSALALVQARRRAQQAPAACERRVVPLRRP